MSFNPFINGGGGTSSEDKVARAEIAAIKDGETLDSFSDVETALDDKADSTTTYTKTEVDTALGNKADKSTTYTKTEVDTALGNKVDKVSGKGLSTNDYTTAEKTKLAGIAEGAEVNVQSNWTQTTTTADDYIKNKPTLGTAAAKNATDTYNATGTDVTTGKAVAEALATLPEPMVFKGSLGTGGTITTLPTASSSNKGYVYKVITAGTYASQSAKVGDTFISDGSAWVLIPSGDEPSGTVTNVAVANGGGLTVSGSPVTSSGTITVGHSNSVTAKTSSSLKKFTYDAYGHVTGSSELSTAESDALASGINSAKVAQIETNKNNISKDEAVLVELVDSGAKNILDVNTSFTTGTIKGVTYTNNGDQTYTITTDSSGSTADDSFVQLYDVNADNLFGVKKGEKVVISSTSNKVGCVIIPKHSGGYGATIRGYKDSPIEYIIPSNFTGFLLRIGVATSGTVVDENVGFMICTKAAWDISRTYQPYAMSNAELTQTIGDINTVLEEVL